MKRFLTVISFAFLILAIGCATSSSVGGGGPAVQDGLAASGPNGVAAAARPEVSDIGIEVLRRGGNAVDAAVAMGFAIGVTEPNASGLGGGGFMLVKLANMPEAVFIDFREIAPGASTPSMYLGTDGNVIPNSHVVGGLAVGTPGEVAGLLYALEHYGSRSMSRQQLMQPAIDLANNGFEVSRNFHDMIVDNIDKINQFPATAAIYTDGGLPLEPGDFVRNPDLARTLTAIANNGADAFYRGPIAEAVVQAVRAAGGIMSLEDLANYQVSIRTPVTGTYRGYTIISAPPPSSGGTHIIQILNMLENMDSRDLRHGNTRSVNAWIHALRYAFADRGNFMADTDFASVPLAGLSNKNYARELFNRFDLNSAIPSATPGDPTRYESGSTTSYSVMDKAGNMVTVSKTINYFFGSGVGVPGVGIIMNNEMDDFVPRPGHVNSVVPYKKPLSSMSPTIVLDPQGRPFMTLGSPGATRIIATVAQIISNVIDNNMSIQAAIEAPRWFTMASGQVHFESRMPFSTVNNIRGMDYDLNVRPDWDNYFGGVQAVLFDHATGRLHGGADPRRDGEARAF